MKVLSLFDGISCGYVALKRAGISIDKYYASEIKPFAIKCSSENNPDIIHIGDITKIHFWRGTLYTEDKRYNLGEIDLVIGGSPCQNFSVARTSNKKTIDGLKGEQSSLFYEYARLLQEIQPRYFLLENVRITRPDDLAEINGLLQVEPIRINSNLVSFQNRDRFYWTNIPNVTIPNDKGVDFQNYKDTDENYCDKFIVPRTRSREIMWGNGVNGKCKNITYCNKVNCLTLKQDRWANSGLIAYKDFCRYLTTRELELAQTLPIGYTKMLTRTQSENVLGDCWTVDVIAHIAFYAQGRTLEPLKTSQGIAFINTRYLKPFSDIDAGYELYERTTAQGKPYIAVKSGFMLLGIISPYDLVNEIFINNLDEILKLSRIALFNKQKDDSTTDTNTQVKMEDMEV